jgi:hypothetical protein
MNFIVTFVQFIDGDFEDEEDIDVFEESYTSDNINPWFTSGDDPILVQTYTKTGNTYTFSDITIPVSGSRIRTGTLPNDVVRKPSKMSDHVHRFLKK